VTRACERLLRAVIALAVLSPSAAHAQRFEIEGAARKVLGLIAAQPATAAVGT